MSKSITIREDEEYIIQSGEIEYFNKIVLYGELVINGLLVVNNIDNNGTISGVGDIYLTEQTIESDVTDVSVHKITETLIAGLPSFFKRSDKSQNYSLMFGISEGLHSSDEFVEDVGSLISNIREPFGELEIKNGELYTIPEGELEIYSSVIVSGTLVVDGKLSTKEIDHSDGKIVDNGELEITERYEKEGVKLWGQMVGLYPREDEGVDHYRARIIATFALTTCDGTINDVINAVAFILDIDKSNITFSESPGSVELSLPSESLQDFNLTEEEFERNAEKLIAPSYTASLISTGTLEYITPEEYENDDYDTSKGYDTVDGDGNPTGEGGTYSSEV